jgi:hypothetical protein
MDNRCLVTAFFVKEVDDLFDSFIGVTHPDHERLLLRLLTNTIRHKE